MIHRTSQLFANYTSYLRNSFYLIDSDVFSDKSWQFLANSHYLPLYDIHSELIRLVFELLSKLTQDQLAALKLLT